MQVCFEDEEEEGKVHQSQRRVKTRIIEGHNIFVEPMMYYYHQGRTQGSTANIGQVPFDSYTYGTAMGYNYQFCSGLKLAIGTGYSHSSIFWKDDFGGGHFNTVYFTPQIIYVGKQFYLSYLFQQSFNFYDINRIIQYSTIKRTANSKFVALDYLSQVEGGYQHYLGYSPYSLKGVGQFSIFDDGDAQLPRDRRN